MLQVFRAVRGRLQTRPLFTASRLRASGQDDKAPEEELSEEDAAQIKDLNEKIAEIQGKIDIAVKDAEQASKRYFQQTEDVAKYAHTKFAKDTLELADNLSRVATSVTPEQIANDAALAEVIAEVKTVQGLLTQFYAKYGITQEDPVGKPFDPNQHEALFEVPLPHQATGTVAHVVQTGYLIHDRVLRAARVGVVRNPK